MFTWCYHAIAFFQGSFKIEDYCLLISYLLSQIVLLHTPLCLVLLSIISWFSFSSMPPCCLLRPWNTLVHLLNYYPDALSAAQWYSMEFTLCISVIHLIGNPCLICYTYNVILLSALSVLFWCSWHILFHYDIMLVNISHLGPLHAYIHITLFRQISQADIHITLLWHITQVDSAPYSKNVKLPKWMK